MEEYHTKEFSLLAAIDKGRKLPQWAEDEPYLEPAEDWLLGAYFDLATCRGVDGAIPWRDMVEYADRAEMDPDLNRAFVRIMRHVDSEKTARSRSTESTAAEAIPAAAPEGAATIPTASKETMRAAALRRATNVKRG